MTSRDGHRPDLVFSKVDSSDKTSLDVDKMLAGQVKTFKSMADYSDIHKRTSAGQSLLDRQDTAEVVQKSFLEQASSGVMGRFLDPKVIARLKKDIEGSDAGEQVAKDEQLLGDSSDSDSDSDSDTGSDSDSSKKRKRKSSKSDKKEKKKEKKRRKKEKKKEKKREKKRRKKEKDKKGGIAHSR